MFTTLRWFGFRTGGAALPVADEKGRDRLLRCEFFRLAFPSRVRDVADASRETVHEGNILYRTYCFHCHGFNAVAGSLPDLRYATAEVHKQFSSIVLGGARESRGMPSFKDVLNETQVHAIEAYVLSRAEESAHPAVN